MLLVLLDKITIFTLYKDKKVFKYFIVIFNLN